MKTKTKITEITHDDLVNLLSTCSCGSSIFMLDYYTSEYHEIVDGNEDDSTEDRMASMLLAGGRVWICDKQAEDKTDFYGKLPHKFDEEYQTMDYSVSLNDIVRGIENAMDGNVEVCEEEHKSLLREYATNFANSESVDFDLPEAEALMQVILWNEWIY